ncbi:MAG TPA: YpdA family putative bacillithiol disulfide reductase [Candidatus Dormibacteraeota bacterium]|nr:YpdA family putative bacillithiol disulfide reductase [Candidatus Dormibacteraeota bacterium]
MHYDLISIGAGPTGLATTVEARRAGLRTLVIDKGCICNSLFYYPTNMMFFTTPERMEIGDLPMVTIWPKPTRQEALKYYRRAAEHYGIEIRQYERVVAVDGQDGDFTVVTRGKDKRENRYQTRKIVVATGYYDQPNRVGIPGEELPHVSHYYTEAHPFWGRDVVVIGAKNSAAEGALDLFRGGARVTLVHRGAGLGASLKYWVRPDIENRIHAGEIQAHFLTSVKRIEPGAVIVQSNGAERTLPADQVFAMTGYHPDFDFLLQLGIELEPEARRPRIDPETLESNVRGIYLAGVLIGGERTGEIFIENGRFHGRKIAAALIGARVTGTEPHAAPGE